MPEARRRYQTGQVYHVFNRGIDHRTTFTDVREFKRIMLALNYYQYAQLPVKLSHYLSDNRWRNQDDLWLNKNHKLVDVIAYCFMPNHFHLLLRQNQDGGISKLLSQLENSYTRYFNVKNRRTGPLFLDRFNSAAVLSESQLLHVSRYIHLNPATAGIVTDSTALSRFPYSSLREYLGFTKSSISDPTMVLSTFKNQADYLAFVLNQADYQKQLARIKHIVLEKTIAQ